MSIYIAGNKAKNIYIGGTQVKSAYLAGQKIYPPADPPGLYYATSAFTSPISIYNNNNGSKGSLVTTIATNNWATLASYAPEIAIAESNICSGWQTAYTGNLNFAKLTTVSDSFFQRTNYNGTILLPRLTMAGTLMFATQGSGGSVALNTDITFPSLTTVGHRFFQGMNKFTKKATFPQLVMNSNFTDFWATDGTLSGNPTLEFQAVQTLTTAPTGAFGFADKINLRLPSGSAGVNVANKTWCGKTWLSITLI
jgi:hypothetical protein